NFKMTGCTSQHLKFAIYNFHFSISAATPPDPRPQPQLPPSAFLLPHRSAASVAPIAKGGRSHVAVSAGNSVRHCRLSITILLRLGRLQATQQRIERSDRLGDSHDAVDATLIAPLAAQHVFVAGPALGTSHHRRPAAFTEHNFAKEK